MKITVALITLTAALLTACSSSQTGNTTGSTPDPKPAATTWETLGSAVNVGSLKDKISARVALDAQNTPYIAWSEPSGSSFNIFAAKWSGSSWERLGGVVSTNEPNTSENFDFAISPAGKPTLISVEGPAGNIMVSEWSGTSWVNTGSTLSPKAYRPSLRFSSTGEAVAAWVVAGSKSYESDFQVQRKSAAGWTSLGSKVDTCAYYGNYSFGIKESGDPVLFNCGHFWTWNGTSWVETATPTQSGSRELTMIPRDGNPIAFNGAYSISTSTLTASRWNGTAWSQLGGAINTDGSAASYAPAFDSSNTPWIAVGEPAPTLEVLRVKRFDGQRWATVGDSIRGKADTNASAISLAITSTGKPVVAYRDGIGASNSLFVARLK
jgi:hypothetical protein